MDDSSVLTILLLSNTIVIGKFTLTAMQLVSLPTDMVGLTEVQGLLTLDDNDIDRRIEEEVAVLG